MLVGRLIGRPTGKLVALRGGGRKCEAAELVEPQIG
jgi:hypothetical protein